MSGKLLVFCLFLSIAGLRAEIPVEPVLIESGVPQFFIDDWLVDDRVALKKKSHAVVHRVHPPVKHPFNPVYSGASGYVNVARHPETGRYQLWTQVHERLAPPRKGTNYAIAYAESDDGISWIAPELDLYEWLGSRGNNIVHMGPNDARASGHQILLTIPEKVRRGFTYIMTYRTGGAGKGNDGIRLVGSNDGIHWHRDSEMMIKHLHSDTLNSIVYDKGRDRYLMTCRAKDRYLRFQGEVVDTGASRRVSILQSRKLWQEWPGQPQPVLIPDEIDADNDNNFFYGMPMHHHAGIYWGFLWVFRLNDPIHTELVTSRDGVHWKRSPFRTPLIPLGEDGAWDDGMTFGGPHWVEVDDEWRFYYAGHDGPHESKDRKAAVGLATCKRERLIGLHGPANGGGIVVTRMLQWPGGDLYINVGPGGGDTESAVSVRVSDAIRNVHEGYNHEDCDPLMDLPSTRQKVSWKNGTRTMQDFAGKAVRLEIFLKNADLFTLLAE
ncbi:MAG: hypothetical protein P1V20_03375 [Verrucomicrobiales bacterium]|nr:hypothetical protein [Verrucomicrobiales bacterium]